MSKKGVFVVSAEKQKEQGTWEVTEVGAGFCVTACVTSMGNRMSLIFLVSDMVVTWYPRSSPRSEIAPVDRTHPIACRIRHFGQEGCCCFHLEGTEHATGTWILLDFWQMLFITQKRVSYVHWNEWNAITDHNKVHTCESCRRFSRSQRLSSRAFCPFVFTTCIKFTPNWMKTSSWQMFSRRKHRKHARCNRSRARRRRSFYSIDQMNWNRRLFMKEEFSCVM